MEPTSFIRKRRDAYPQRNAPAKRRKVTLSMAQSYVGQTRIRRYIGKIIEFLQMPNQI